MTRRVYRRTAQGVAMRVAAAIAGPIAGLPSFAAAATPMLVRVENQRLSVELGRVPLHEVLIAVAAQTGARLTMKGDLGQVAPQAFTGVPIAEGLARLASGNGLLLEFAPTRDGSAAKLVTIRAVAPKGGQVATSGELQPRQAVAHAAPNRDGMPANFWNYQDGSENLPSPDVRIARINQIGRQRGPASEAALTAVVSADPEAAVRAAAVHLLAAFRTDAARAALTQAANDGETEVRIEALRALGSQPAGAKPVEVLVRALMGDADREVRITAANLLSTRDGPTAKAALEAAAGADQDQQLREIARQALRR